MNERQTAMSLRWWHRIVLTALTVALFTGALAAGMVSTAAPAQAAGETEVVDIPVPKAIVAAAFDKALGTMTARVHNYGSKHGSGSGITWHDDASHVLLPTGSKVEFPVPEYVFNVPGTNKTRKLKYYVNDLKTQSIDAGVAGSRIDIRVGFESAGEEVKVRCIRRLFGKWKECSLDMERDIHLNNAGLDISLKPVAHKGSISFATVTAGSDVVFDADIKIANKLCKAFKGVCGWIEDKIEGKLTPTIEKAVAAQLNKASVRDKVATGIRDSLADSGLVDPAWKVTSVTASGNNFIVRVERPVVIDGSSVKKLTLAPVKAHVTATCPATVQLKATIEMKHTVSGTGYLSYENGSKSGTFNWSAGKGQTVTSTLSRQFVGNPGQTKNGWATMHLSWKGSDGKTKTKVSNQANFTVTCSFPEGGVKAG